MTEHHLTEGVLMTAKKFVVAILAVIGLGGLAYLVAQKLND